MRMCVVGVGVGVGVGGRERCVFADVGVFWKKFRNVNVNVWGRGKGNKKACGLLRLRGCLE